LRASQAAETEPAAAVRWMVEAYNLMGRVLHAQDQTWEDLLGVWEKSRFPKNRTVDGKEFVWVLDDVKDHFADRRKGLDYMLAPFQRMNMPEWRESLLERVRDYADLKGVPVEGLPEERLED